MKLVEFASNFFRGDREQEDAERHEICRQALDWMGQAYHKRFMAWLEDNGMKEIPVSSNHMDLVQSTVRGNTFREVRNYLLRLERECSATLDRFKGE